ncbi:MAG: tetratricopeptide repeat protein [Deltaproteobacteria bacterium]|nr:MAG: tetratricopeptide repeat protein [Deltaproteobacteria bacterium]
MVEAVEHLSRADSSRAEHERRPGVRAGAAVAAGLALIVYINSLPNGFLSDDVQTIAFSSAAGSPFNLRGLLIGPGLIVRGGSRGTYGPVTAWTFLVAHVMGADLPLVHHLANVVCHVAAAALLVLAAAATGLSPPAATLAGALFAVHPIHTEAVAHIASRGSVLSTALVLLALLWWRRAGSIFQELGALAVCALALLADEQALAVLLLLPLADFVLPRDASSDRRLGARRVVLYAGLVVLAVVYVVLRRAALSSAGAVEQTGIFQANPAALLPAGLRIVTGLKVTALAISKLFVPARLSADYSYRQLSGVQSLAEAGALVGLFAGVALAVVANVLWTRHRAAFFWMAFALITYGVVSNIPFAWEVLFREDMLYMPSAGVCALVALPLARLSEARGRTVGAVVAAVLVVAGGVVTVLRNPVWHDDLRLAQATAAVAPESARAHRMLGTALSDADQQDDAIKEFGRALAIYPGDRASLYNVGVILQRQDKPLEAISVFRRVTDLDPKYAPAWINIAAINNTQTAFNPALDAAQRAIDARPEIPNGYVVKGHALRGMGRFKEAREAFEEALRRAPAQPEALLGLGATAIDLQDWSLATSTFERLIKVAPVQDAYRGLVYSYRQAGREADASDTAALARSLFPGDDFFSPEGPPSP